MAFTLPHTSLTLRTLWSRISIRHDGDPSRQAPSGLCDESEQGSGGRARAAEQERWKNCSRTI